MSSPANYPKFHAFDPSTGLPLVGGKLYTYAAGTTTPLATYSDAALTVPNANPIILDSNGEAVIYVGPLAYKFVLQKSDGSAVWTFDNYAPNVAAQTAGEWTQYNSSTLVYTSTTSFRTLAADTTAIFTAGRRIKATVTAGTVYGTVISSTFTAIGGYTDVSVVMDGTSVLDAGLSAVWYGLLSYTKPSYLDPESVVIAKLTADILGYAAKTQVTTFTEIVDANNEFSAGVFTCKYPGYYDIEFRGLSKDTAASQPQVIYININGTDIAAGVISTIVASTQISTLASVRGYPLSAGDVVKMYFLGTANSTLLATGGIGSLQTLFQVKRVR